METDSENRGRGRPRKYDYEALDEIQEFFGTTTRRGQQNHYYGNLAFQLIGQAVEEKPDMAPFVGVLVGEENIRPTVLAELGRILDSTDDNELIGAAVRYAAENTETPAKRVVATLRSMRLGEPPDVIPRIRLHKALIRTINDHLARYPNMTNRDIEEALIITEGAVEKRPEN
jgi:hypothetical protein